MEENLIKEKIQHFLDLRRSEEGTINAMMDMKILYYDIEKKRVTVSYPVHKWQLNPTKNMHGGMISTALDMSMGCAAYAFSDGTFTPTIQMAINFNKSIKEHDELIVEAVCDHAGSRMVQVRAIAKVKDCDDVVASANGSYAVNHT
ncbi:PaaI family thioesterase [Amedibacillus sp. YH-ame10]